MIKRSGSILDKGFTLIELLVVITIIGILSVVVLSSLRQSNAKARDSKVKSQLNAMIAPAQLYYDVTSGNWNSICNIEPMDSMKISAGAVSPTGLCQSSGQIGWRAAAALATQNLHTASPPSGTDYWCVDYTAATRICDTLPSGTYPGAGGNVYICPTTAPELCR